MLKSQLLDYSLNLLLFAQLYLDLRLVSKEKVYVYSIYNEFMENWQATIIRKQVPQSMMPVLACSVWYHTSLHPARKIDIFQ